MTEPSLQRIEELFNRTVDLEPPQRAVFLEEQCGGDADLRAAVEELLRLHSKAEADESLLRSPLAGSRPRGQALPAPPVQTVGRYRVLRLLGEGGMGTVYEAEQDNPRRTVALKVIRAGLTSDFLLQRFAREAQILGRLQHPGIAHVYDAGVAENGQPYFAMELIAGVPLDRYAREQALDAPGRLELVARVCDAVQHAHERGVIHRDLKPGNVLVEASGQPRVLDFGVARAADLGLTAGGGRTEAGQLLGTLRYMSPEQASGDPSAIDPRGDVYALGVILYELLAHRPPYSLDGLPLPEAVRVIREQEPARLGALEPRLRGDVETIAARAVEKEPQRRYPSAAELAADIRRHLSHEPIRARPPSAIYRLRKFTRRHKALVGAALGVMAALAAGTVVSVLYAVRADRNARQARHQTYLARLAAATAALSHHDVADAARQLEAAPQELRGWEWRHLHARLDDSAAVLPAGHLLRRGPSGFHVAVFTPDALVLSDEEGKRISSTPRPAPPGGWPVIHSADDATWLVAEIVDRPGGVIRLLESTDRERLLRLPPGHSAIGLQFSPDGKRLAVLQEDRSISICDVSACRETAYLVRDRSNYHAMAFSDDGRRLAVAADSSVVSVWDPDTGRVVVGLRTHTPKVTAVALHPRGERLLTASPEGTVHQWDLRTGREVEPPYDRHEGQVKALAYSPDGLRVASSGQDRSVRLWRAEGRRYEAVLHGHTRSVVGLAFSRDGRRLASWQDDGVARLWDTGPDATLPVLRGHTSYVYPVAYTPDGRRIASGSWDGTVRLWDAATGQSVATPLPQGGFVRALALSPDGKRLVAMGDGTDGLRVWDVASGGRMATYTTADNALWAVAYRPGGGHVAVLGSGHVIEVLDAATGQRLTTADAGRLEPWAARRALAYSPDGRLLAGPYEGNRVGLWEAETYRLVGTLTGHEGTVLSVAFNADGSRLVSAGADSLIKVWDVGSKDCLLTLQGHADEVFAAVFHPTESRIASGGSDRLVRLWDAVTGEELVRLPGHSDYVFSLAFSPDGKTLVSSSGDSTLRLWDTEPLRERSLVRRAAEPARPKAD
jgi:WD40 repeat protein/predicted Ser/Thr protein kinase/type II secretory pathway pseudopilin PulG